MGRGELVWGEMGRHPLAHCHNCSFINAADSRHSRQLAMSPSAFYEYVRLYLVVILLSCCIDSNHMNAVPYDPHRAVGFHWLQLPTAGD